MSSNSSGVLTQGLLGNPNVKFAYNFDNDAINVINKNYPGRHNTAFTMDEHGNFKKKSLFSSAPAKNAKALLETQLNAVEKTNSGKQVLETIVPELGKANGTLNGGLTVNFSSRAGSGASVYEGKGNMTLNPWLYTKKTKEGLETTAYSLMKTKGSISTGGIGRDVVRIEKGSTPSYITTGHELNTYSASCGWK